MRTHLRAAVVSNEGIPIAVPTFVAHPAEGLIANVFDLQSPKIGVVWAMVELPGYTNEIGETIPKKHAIEWVYYMTHFGPELQAVCRDQSDESPCEPPYITANDLEWWNRTNRSVVTTPLRKQ